MAYKKSSAPLSFAKSAFLLAITIIILSARLSQAMPGKASADAEVSFVSSESDWSKDLDNVKPFGPSANAANLDPHIGSSFTNRSTLLEPKLLTLLIAS